MPGQDEEERLIPPGQVKETSVGVRYIFSKRWLLAYITFFGVFCLYVLRVNLSVAVVCMVNTTKTKDNVTTFNSGDFSWSKSTTSQVLSAYFYGYLILQLPGGWAAGRFGPTKVIALSTLLSSVATLLIPVSARHGLGYLYATRVIVGLCGSVTYPALQSMWGRWAPPQERTMLTSVSYSGGYFGTIVAFMLSGYLCDHGFDGGWPSIFYLSGGISLLWTIVWFLFVYDNPTKHPSISQREKHFITTSLGERSQKPPPTPWKGILTSPPFWALIMAIMGVSWVDYTFLTSLPQYMEDVLDYDITQNGILSAVPSICQFASSLVCGQVADWMRAKGLSTRLVRNIFQVSVFVGVSGCLLGVGYVDKDHRSIAVVLLGVAGFFSGFQPAGYIANFIDIAPRHVGVMYGIGNCFATIPGFVTPNLVGAITKQSTRTEWQTVFDICVGVSLFSALVFVIFSSGHVQPWGVEKGDDTDKTSDEDHDETRNQPVQCPDSVHIK